MGLSNLIIVTPVFEDNESLLKLISEIKKIGTKDSLMIIVNDGSIANPPQFSEIQRSDQDFILVNLKRNVGHQFAIAIGLSLAKVIQNKKTTTVIMDSDGEDIPYTIKSLVSKLGEPSTDIVVAKRNSRYNNLTFKLFYFIYKKIFNFLTAKRIGFGNFMAIKSHALTCLLTYPELPLHIAATVLLSKLRVKEENINRGPRYFGISKANFSFQVLHGLKALMVFSETVLVRGVLFCFLISAISISAILAAVILKIFGYATPGWFSTALGILILILIQMAAFCVIGLMTTGSSKGKINSDENEYRKVIKNIEIGIKLNTTKKAISSLLNMK
jgi:glycosyltransferase involved in cell wall biosynthesis